MRVTSLRRCQKLPLCPTESMPAGFQTHPLLAKAEPISDSSSTSGITEFKKGGKTCTIAGRGVKVWERNNSADSKITEG